MKRKIALLLSVIMTVSGLSTNVFAAGSNTLQHAASSVKVIINDTVTVGDIRDLCSKCPESYNLNMDVFKSYSDSNTLTVANAFKLLNDLCNKLPEAKGYNLYSKPNYDMSKLDVYTKDYANLYKAGLLPQMVTSSMGTVVSMNSQMLNDFFTNLHRYYGQELKNDYYATENKSYLDSMVLDEDDEKYEKSIMSDTQTKNENNYDKILDDIVKGTYAEGTKERQVQDFYKSLIDMDARNARGAEPIKKYLDGIDKANNLNELLSYLKESCNIYNYPLIGFAYDVDLNDSTKSTIYLSPCVDESIADMYRYATTTDVNQKIMEYYVDYFTDAGEDDATAKKDAKNYDIIARQVAQAMTRDNNNSFDDYMDGKDVKQVKLSEVQKYYKTLNIADLCKSFGFNVTDSNCCTINFEATKAWGSYLDNSRIDQLKALAKFNIINIYSEALDYNVYYGKNKIVSKDEMKEDVKDIVEHYMGTYLDQIYCEKYLPKGAKEDVTSIAKEVINQYKNRINKLDWLSDASKKEAIKKLDNMIITVGNPDWSDIFVDFKLPTLENGGNSFVYFEKMYSQLSASEAAKMNKPHTRIYWETGSVVYCNAEYVRRTNSINIYTGILQDPIYSPSYSREKKLGSIGYIIAHEISHAFDASGADYDENGNNKPWWNDKEKEKFEDKCDSVVKLYDSKPLVTDLYTSGAKTEDENVADISAMRCVLDIMNTIENADYKSFFNSFASSFAGGATRKYLAYLISEDEHANYGVRVNTVLSNFQEFYDTYGISEGDAMYVKPENRITIW